MKPADVVLPDVLVDDSPQFPRHLVLLDLHAFRFERPEPALYTAAALALAGVVLVLVMRILAERNYHIGILLYCDML